MNYNFLNYCTEYSSKGTNNKRMSRDVCFSKVFVQREDYQSNYYKIKIYKGETQAQRSLDNNCLLSIDDVRHHIELLRDYMPFKFRLQDKGNYFLLHLHVDGKNIYHRFILTWIRYVYEFPFNFMIVDINKIRKEKSNLKNMNTINLFNLIGATLEVGGGGIHSFTRFCSLYSFMTKKKICNKLKDLYTLNKLFPEIYYNKQEIHFKVLDIHKNDVNSTDYWLNEENFSKRLSLYEHNYEILKQIKR